MKRIDTSTREANAHGVGKDGFRDGIAPGVEATDLNADWFNGVQEEIANVIEGAGLTLDGDDNAQLLYAIARRYFACDAAAIGVASSGKFTLSNVQQAGGFVVASNEIQVPVPGVYLVQLMVHAKWANTSNPNVCDIALAGGHVDHAFGVRWNADPTVHLPVTATSLLVSIGSLPAPFYLVNGTTGGAVTTANQAVGATRIVITQFAAF